MFGNISVGEATYCGENDIKILEEICAAVPISENVCEKDSTRSGQNSFYVKRPSARVDGGKGGELEVRFVVAKRLRISGGS